MTTNPPPLPRLIRRRDLQRALDVSSETIRRWLISGKLPPPDVAVSDQASWWREDTLAAAGFNVVPANDREPVEQRAESP